MNELECKTVNSICEVRDRKNMPPISLVFRYFQGPIDYWINNKCLRSSFEPVNYHADDVKDIKMLIQHLVNVLWEQHTCPDQHIILYIDDIIAKDDGIDILIDGYLVDDIEVFL